MAEKTGPGNFFEDFHVGQSIVHSTPRAITEGDVSLYTALYGSRFAVNSSSEFARSLGFSRAPVDDLLAFHLVFGKTVPDISRNAVANLGYASGVFGVPVYSGDTISATSTIIGLKQNTAGRAGVVYVRSQGANQRGEMVIDYCRWVMVRKNNLAITAPGTVVPELLESVPVGNLIVPKEIDAAGYCTSLAGSMHLWDDYQVGEKIDHLDGMTVEEAEHMMATRLFQNTARVHFNQHAEKSGRFGRRIVYGGHIISLARSLSFNGLANAFKLVAINAGRHVAPVFAGDTIYAWSEILDKAQIPARTDVGILRLRTVATKDRACREFPYKDAESEYDPSVILDFDYTVLMAARR